MNRTIRLIGMLLPLVLLAGAAGAAPPAATPSATAAARVTYITGGSIYLDAGRSRGLAPGDTVEVVREGGAVAWLRVAFVSAAKASCDTLRTASAIRVGDAARFRPRAVEAPPQEEPAGAPPDSARVGPGPAPLRAAPGGTAKRRTPPLRGRVGVGLVTVQGTGGAPGYAQPALSVKLDGAAEYGAPVDFTIDVRAHRTYHGGASDGIARVYRLSTAIHDAPGHRRLSLGRQLLPVASSAGLFDGALAQVGDARWSAGVFSGLEPDPVAHDFSTDVVQSGVFLQRRSAAAADRRWIATLGFLDSRDRGSPSRDFAFLQGFWMSPRVVASVSQEVDINAGWKRELGDPAVSLTSTFATARLQATRQLSLNAGFDNRRNVRLYRDRETPVTEFDDRYRQGGWLGASVNARPNLRVSATSRMRSGGAGGSAWTESGAIEAYRLTPLQGVVALRSTRVESDVEQGWLHSGSLGVAPWTGIRLTGTVGAQQFTDLASGAPRSVDWQSVDADLGLARRWYLLLSAEHDRDSAGDRVQSYSSLNWIF
jgi:hypothetical protein